MAKTSGVPPQAPTAPGRVPLLGHVPRLLRNPVGTLRKLRSRGGVVTLYIGTKPVYLVNSPQLLHKVLVTEAASYAKGRMYDKARPVVGNGLATSQGAFHHRQRRLMAPAFRRERLHAYAEVMRRQAEAMTSTWRDGQRLAMDKALHRVAAAIAFTALFGADLDEEAVDEIDLCVAGFLKEVAVRTVSPGFVEKLHTPGSRRFNRLRERMTEIVETMIDAHLKDPDSRQDLLSMLVSAADETTGATMSAQQLHDEVMTLLVSAPDTTGSTMSWLFYELGRRPQMQRRLQAEVDAVLDGRPVAFDDVAELEYTRRLVDETLRLHAVSWLQMRRTLKPVELGDVRLPAGAEILFSAAALHRDPHLYPDPLRFDPDRWASPPPRETFIPFSAGPRKCIADHFARLQMTIVTATVAADWRTRLLPSPRVREVPAAVLRPNHLPMTVHTRHRTPS
ncbi:MAG: cytochrome P450 [Stackebrandtia sp.]